MMRWCLQSEATMMLLRSLRIIRELFLNLSLVIVTACCPERVGHQNRRHGSNAQPLRAWCGGAKTG